MEKGNYKLKRMEQAARKWASRFYLA